MEINNFNEKFWEIGKKYTLNQIDKNGDGILSKEEVLSLIEQDEEVSTQLKTTEIDEIEEVSDISESSETSVCKNGTYVLGETECAKRMKEDFDHINLEFSTNHRGDYTLQDCANGVANLSVWECLSYHALSTINSYKDLNELPDEIDIDGDGKVSDNEKYYVKNLKILAYFYLNYNLSNNSSNIDEIISREEYIKNNPIVLNIEQDYYNMYKQNAGIIDQAYIALKVIGNKYDISVDLNSYMGINPLNQGWGTSDYEKNIQAQIDNKDPILIYKNYIYENNLSKAELTEILDKINSASSSVQSRLSEVKIAVQQKLEALK